MEPNPSSPLFRCPACGAPFAPGPGWRCASGHEFPVADGIPQLFAPHAPAGEGESEDVTERIKAFYEETPFPNYDGFDDVDTLRAKARRGVFARLLDDQVPTGVRVLECGCGTGQLSNFLALKDREVYGTDLCLNSLRLGRAFARAQRIEGVTFLQMNLFRPCFAPGSFDLVVSSGVLHHTSDPRGGFESIARLVKPGGHILVGLYHRYARLGTDLRRRIFRLSGGRWRGLDPRLRGKSPEDVRGETWFRDQYLNPHESKHTVGEVLRWLPGAGLEFVKSIPKTRFLSRFAANERLFAPERPGGRVQRALKEVSLAPGGAREGGFFVVIARRTGT